MLHQNEIRGDAKHELAHFDVARKAIQRATCLDEVKNIRDKAEALRLYVRQSGHSLELQNRCAEMKLRAERRAGEMLRAMPKNVGARGKGVRFHDGITPTLEQLGLTLQQSHRWQKIAGIPESDFDSFLAKTGAERKEPTSTAVLRFAAEIETWRSLTMRLMDPSKRTLLLNVTGQSISNF